MKFFSQVNWFYAFFFFSGCATTPQHPVALTGDILVDGPNMIANGSPRDKVLWQYRTAAAAIRRAKFDEAKALLDDALLSISGIVANDKNARQSRGYFHEESKKTFHGEPYERVMAYYYRGILYWMDGEPDNARACFRSAAIQDADAENREYAADYVLLDYLDALASAKLGGDGSDALQRAQTEAKNAKPQQLNPRANVLFFVEFGPGPTKYAAGQYGEELRFHCVNSPVTGALVRVGKKVIRCEPNDDLNFQATTRGGRVMDHILANKAVFKTATDVAGTAAIIGGTVAVNESDQTSQEVGLGLLAAGAISKIVSAITMPQADTRSWDNLPRYLSIASLELPPGKHLVAVDFVDANNRVLPQFSKSITIRVESNSRDKVVFVSDQSSTPQTI